MESLDSEFSEEGGYGPVRASFMVKSTQFEWFSCIAHLGCTVAYAVEYTPGRHATVCVLPENTPRTCMGHVMNWPFGPKELQKAMEVKEHD